ncbi:hypothetical protein D3C80_2187410 [compost metagenome]
MAQVRLRLVEAYPHFQPGLALVVGQQVDDRQVGQLHKDVGQGRRADTLQVH